jgi:hypothetical protein
MKTNKLLLIGFLISFAINLYFYFYSYNLQIANRELEKYKEEKIEERDAAVRQAKEWKVKFEDKVREAETVVIPEKIQPPHEVKINRASVSTDSLQMLLTKLFPSDSI